MEAELTTLNTATIEVEWLRELLMNRNNQIVIVKENNSKDNIKSSSRVKRRSKYVRKLKLWSYSLRLCSES